jgi:hypothetical protein
MSAPIVAWKISVTDEPEDGETVVFARHRWQALRAGVRTDLCRADGLRPDEIGCARAPGFDRYAPGPIGPREYLAEGWGQTCAHCRETVYWQGCSECADEQTFAHECEEPPVIVGDDAYCDEICFENAQARRREARP